MQLIIFIHQGLYSLPFSRLDLCTCTVYMYSVHVLYSPTGKVTETLGGLRFDLEFNSGDQSPNRIAKSTRVAELWNKDGVGATQPD
jgi:hypothetical protein